MRLLFVAIFQDITVSQDKICNFVICRCRSLNLSFVKCHQQQQMMQGNNSSDLHCLVLIIWPWTYHSTDWRRLDFCCVFYRNMIGCESLKGWQPERWPLQWRGPSHGRVQTQSQNRNQNFTLSGLTLFHQPSFKSSLQFYCPSFSCLLHLLT